MKLLDYVGREAELEAEANPFALLVLTHLQSLATRKDPKARRQWKLRLIKGLYTRSLSDEEEQRMAFVTYAERHGMERGMEKGMEKGLHEGLLTGIEAILEVKHGPAGLALLPQIRALNNPEQLKKILAALKTAATLEGIPSLLAPPVVTSGAAAGSPVADQQRPG